MKTNSIYKIACIALLAAACNNSTREAGKQETFADSSIAGTDTLASNSSTIMVTADTLSLFGFYVGGFNATEYKQTKQPMLYNKINISIDSISEATLYGHSVVAGNIRPFKGDFVKDGALISAIVKEPGDNKYDGTFTFTLNGISQKLSGSWNSNDKNLPVTVRTYTLEKRYFAYDPNQELGPTESDVYYSDAEGEFSTEIEKISNDAGKYNASSTLLTPANVENMFKRDLEVMRNAIYARHGYSFKNRQMRFFFDSDVDWYIPVSTDVSKELTNLEKKNIALIKRYEKHAESYYDSYGR